MRVTVVINTLDRAASLATTLDALLDQRGVEFEVVVVNGPSADDTEALLTSHPGRPRLERCGVPNLAVSRNLGVAAAAGALVAFIDDDAEPEPGWLAAFTRAYADPRVVGAGGPVLKANGGGFEWECCRCDRIGTTDFGGTPPQPHETAPGADPFFYLTGTNMSFRRDALVAAGGFDEEFDYGYDEVDLCLRLIDAGGVLARAADALVVHKRLASHTRNEHDVYVDPFPVIKNHFYFALRHGVRTRVRDSVLAAVSASVAAFAQGTAANLALGRISASELDFFRSRVVPAIATGIEHGSRGSRLRRCLGAAEPERFRPFGGFGAVPVGGARRAGALG